MLWFLTKRKYRGITYRAGRRSLLSGRSGTEEDTVPRRRQRRRWERNREIENVFSCVFDYVIQFILRPPLAGLLN